MPKEDHNTCLFVILGAILIFVGIYFLFRKRPEEGEAFAEPVERYSMRSAPPPNVERVENVLGRLEETFHLSGVPQSINIPEMVVGLGVGPGILGNMRNPTENIYLGPNTGIF